MAVRTFSYGIAVDDQGSVVFDRFKRNVLDGGKEVEGSFKGMTDATKKHGEETNKLSQFIRTQRTEQREQSFLFRQLKDVVGTAGVGLAAFGNTVGQSSDDMKKLTNTLNQSYVTFQGFDFLLASLGAGPAGTAVAAIAAVGVAMISVVNDSKIATESIKAFFDEAAKSPIFDAGDILQKAQAREAENETKMAQMVQQRIALSDMLKHSSGERYTELLHTLTILNNTITATQEQIDFDKEIIKETEAKKKKQDEYNKIVALGGQIIQETAKGEIETVNRLIKMHQEAQVNAATYQERVDAEKSINDLLAYRAELELEAKSNPSVMVSLAVQTKKASEEAIMYNQVLEDINAKLLFGDIAGESFVFHVFNPPLVAKLLKENETQVSQSLQNIFSNPLIEKLPNMFKLPKTTLDFGVGSGLDTIAGLQTKIKAAKFEMDHLVQSSKEWLELKSQVDEWTAKLAGLEAQAKNVGMSFEQIAGLAERGLGDLDRLLGQNASAETARLESMAQKETKAIDAQKNKELKAIEDKKNADIRALDLRLKSATLTAEQRNALELKRFNLENGYADQRDQVDEKYTAQKLARQEEYDRQIKESKVEEFNQHKAIAILEAVINTALGVTAALKTADIPLAIVIGALGAVETAIIASQPTPTFHEGGMMTSGGRVSLGSDERPAILKVGETVRTKEQEAALNGGQSVVNYHLHFEGANIASKQAFKEIIQEGMRDIGATSVDDYIKNTRMKVSIF